MVLQSIKLEQGNQLKLEWVLNIKISLPRDHMCCETSRSFEYYVLETVNKLVDDKKKKTTYEWHCLSKIDKQRTIS